MIHTVNTMTIGRYALFDRTKEVRYLKMWYNPFPASWFKKQLNKFTEDFQLIVNSSDYGYEQEMEMDKIISGNNIIQLSALYTGLYNSLVYKIQVNQWLRGVNKPQQKVDLKYFVDRVEKLTNINIEKLSDLEKLSNEIQRRVDKHIEMYPVKEKDEDREEITFLGLVMGVFNMVDWSYNGNMTLAGFKEVKLLADKRAKAQEKQLAKAQQHG